MKRLLADIETKPNKVWKFDLYDRMPTSIDQVIEPGQMICWAAKWHGSKRVMFRSEFHDGQQKMVEDIHGLLEEADVLIHYNGKKFDVPHLNRAFLAGGLKPPAPYQQVDLWKVVDKQFNFPSSKLAYVLSELGLSAKLETGGFWLWKACMEGDPKAWARMRRYNIRDVTALEELYDFLLPWIPSHPSQALEGQQACPSCGSGHLQRRGYAVTRLSRFQRYQCQDCGAWSRDTRRESGAVVSQVA